jgi:oligoendopeptidase F
MAKPRDVSTMAHELGHAIHDMLSAQKQTLINFHPILPLAETASVFAEMLVTDQLLKTETSKAAKIALLTDKLEDIFATSHRQNMFSRFEMVTHKEISGRLLDANELCELYTKELKLMFGKSISYPKEYQWEWSTIPHIFESPFYVHSYNFGNLLVMALYQQYLEEGKSFIPKYKALLSMGSAARPIEITQIVGADINDEKFWQKSIMYIESLLNQLKELTA